MGELDWEFGGDIVHSEDNKNIRYGPTSGYRNTERFL